MKKINFTPAETSTYLTEVSVLEQVNVYLSFLLHRGKWAEKSKIMSEFLQDIQQNDTNP